MQTYLLAATLQEDMEDLQTQFFLEKCKNNSKYITVLIINTLSIRHRKISVSSTFSFNSYNSYNHPFFVLALF